MFLHTFNTWLIANLLHPLMIMAFGWVIYGHEGILFYADVAKGYLLVLGVSILCSLPSLLIGWFLLGVVVLTDYTPLARLIMWMCCSSILVFLEVLVMALIVREPLTLETFSLAIPGILAVNAAIIIRYGQFRQLISSLQTDDHENNLV
jgi:hypothetical protein